jgi:cysteine-rich repeat protein
MRTLIPILLCSGCLARDITDKINQLHCDDPPAATGTSTGDDSMGCPSSTGDSEGSAGTTAETTGTTTTGMSGTDSESADAGSTVTSSTDASSSTGEPVAVCGNGVTEKFGEQPEECDDANDDPADGCSNCGRDRIVFVTSTDYQGAIFEGITGADQRCGNRAGTAGLPNFLGYKAWISDSQTSAKDRLFRGRGRYMLVNGLVVADSWDALLAGALQNPINVTELSETKNYQVWTGTTPDGNAAVGADHCADWTELNLANMAFWGRSGEINGEWTIADSVVDQPGTCTAERALYCFEQE